MSQYNVNGAPLGGGGGGGSGLPVASGADEIPVSTGAGTTYAAQSAGDVLGLGLVAVLGSEDLGKAIIADGAGDAQLTSDAVSTFLASVDADAATDSIEAARKSLIQSLLGATFGRDFQLYAPVSQVLPFGSLTSMDNDLAPMVYEGTGKTITAGINADITGFGLPVGTSLLFNFTQANQTSNGVYIVTYAGADDDPGPGAPAVFARRADFDDSGEIVRGACIPVSQVDNEPGGYYRLQGNGPFTLDSSNLIFVEQRFPTPTLVQTTTTNAGSDDGYVILGDATGGNISVQLQAAANCRGPITVKKIDASGNTVTILPDDPGETIDGATSLVLSTQYASVTLHSGGALWFVTAQV